MNTDFVLKTVLLVEDEESLAKALRLKLVESGLNVVTANNGVMAIEKLKDGGFDLVLVDLLVPEVDGWEILEICRQQKIKAIVVSNLGQEEDMDKAKKLGAVRFIIKSETSLSEIADFVRVELGL